MIIGDIVRISNKNLNHCETNVCAYSGMNKVEGYFFTEEELKQFLQDYTNRIVENTKLEHRLYAVDGTYKTSDLGEEICLNDITKDYPTDYCGINKESITSQLEPFLKERL